jgi:hypothetical protein
MHEIKTNKNAQVTSNMTRFITSTFQGPLKGKHV